MPFKLKNARATFQQMVDRKFKNLIGHTMKVYVDDILVKSKPLLIISTWVKHSDSFGSTMSS